MKSKSIIFVICLLGIHLATYAQYTIDSKYIPDSEFQWTKTSSVKKESTCKEIFSKVEIDPIISEFSKNEFQIYLKEAISHLNIRSSESGIIKVRFYFLEDAPLHTENVGVKDLNLSEQRVRSLASQFNSIKGITRGNQRGLNQDSIGILYIFISNGKLDRFRNVNFEIRED